MKKYLTMMVALAVTLFSINSFAWDPPPTPAPASWISDTSGVLSVSAHARLDAKLKQINQNSANEIAALVVPTLDGQSIEDVTNATFKGWGVGKKGLDNGVLVVLAMKEHKSRIETGKGVEGDLPDLKTQDILVQARPYLRKGDVEGALGFIFASSASAIANHKADAAAGGSRPSCDVSGGVGAGSNSSLIFTLVATAGLGLLFWYLSVSTRRRHEREQREAQARLTASLQAQRAERERQRKAEEARLQHLQAVNQPAPVIAPITAQLKRVTHTPHPITRDGEPVESVVEPTRHAPIHLAKPSAGTTGVAVATGIALAAAEEEARRHSAEAARRRRERDEEDARRSRERAEEDRRRRDREEDDRRSSSSSSSSSDWGGSSSGGGSDSGGFGGGDSGGGGSSGDW